VATDRQAVVIRGEANPPSGPSGIQFRYCARAKGPFRVLIQPSNTAGSSTRHYPTGPYSLTLAGPFVAYAAFWGYRGNGINWWMTVVDTDTGQRVQSGDEASAYVPSHLLVSRSGAAAWIWTVAGYDQTTHQSTYTAELWALNFRTRTTELLDSAPSSGYRSSGQLADLQLYDCMSGCSHSTSVIAWTNAGARRSARLQ
jgi:hypothetical protein